MASWSSLECSPACHAGDRGFKSHRGRLENGVVRKSAKRRSSNLRDLRVRLPPSPLEQHATIGHWQAQLAVTQPSLEDLQVQLLLVALNHGPFVYRFRMPAPHAGERRCPVRFPHGLLNMTKWCNWKTRDAQNVVPVRLGSSNLPLVTDTLQARQVPNWLP